MDSCNVKWWTSIRIAYSLCKWGSGTLKRAWAVSGVLAWYTKISYFECPSIVTQLCCGLWWMKVEEENWNPKTIEMNVFDCMKCIYNWVVHKMWHSDSKFDTKNNFLAWMHTVWTLGLNEGKCYMWELVHCWNVRLVWWTHSMVFMMLDRLDTLECTCNEAWNMSIH